MYGAVRIQLTQVYSQKSTSTTFPRNASAVSGGELTHRCAFNDGKLLAALARHEAATTPRHSMGRVTLITRRSSHEQGSKPPTTGVIVGAPSRAGLAAERHARRRVGHPRRSSCSST